MKDGVDLMAGIDVAALTERERDMLQYRLDKYRREAVGHRERMQGDMSPWADDEATFCDAVEAACEQGLDEIMSARPDNNDLAP